jgi:hypothetical protein
LCIEQRLAGCRHATYSHVYCVAVPSSTTSPASTPSRGSRTRAAAVAGRPKLEHSAKTATGSGTSYFKDATRVLRDANHKLHSGVLLQTSPAFSTPVSAVSALQLAHPAWTPCLVYGQRCTDHRLSFGPAQSQHMQTVNDVGPLPVMSSGGDEHCLGSDHVQLVIRYSYGQRDLRPRVLRATCRNLYCRAPTFIMPHSVCRQ